MDHETDNQAAFYAAQGDILSAQVHTRGPWSPEHQHGGPPAALLARAIEQGLRDAPDMHVARITFELLRPVPIVPLRIQTHTLHAGRKLQVREALLLDQADKPLIHARAVAMRRQAVDLPPVTEPVAAPRAPARSAPFEFGFFSEDVGYHTAMETRLAEGTHGSGRVAVWMRMRLPLVAGEAPSPLQRVVIAADSGNGVSAFLDPARHTFINPDLTVYLHRPPLGEWVCLQAQTLAHNEGVGLADTRLYDEQGPIGRSDQSLIIQARQ